MKKISLNLLFTTILMTLNNLSYAQGDDNINYLDILSEYNREISLHPDSLLISNIEFKEENCQRLIEFKGALCVREFLMCQGIWEQSLQNI